jgi:hypothetical protein
VFDRRFAAKQRDRPGGGRNSAVKTWRNRENN